MNHSNNSLNQQEKNGKPPQLDFVYRLGLYYNVIPVNGKFPPCFSWKEFQSRKVTPEEIQDWWVNRTFPKKDGSGTYKVKKLNFGLVTGHIPYSDTPGIVVVDSDDNEGNELVKSLCPETPVMQRTGRGGWHRIYLRPPINVIPYIPIREKTVYKGKLYNVDIRADGGYICAPGSIHPDTGNRYTEVTPWTLELIASCPVYDPLWLPDDREKTTPNRSPAARASTAHRPDLPLSAKQELAADWLRVRPGTVKGKAADKYCFALAMGLVHGFALEPEEALPVFLEWGEKDSNQYEDGTYYPWTEAQLMHKLTDAANKEDGRGQGYLLPFDDSQVEDIVKAVDPPKKKKDDPKAEAWKNVFGEDYYHSPPPPEAPSIRFESWDETCAIAAKQQEDWLIPHWAEFGCLHILTGLPFSGKSLLISELIACMSTGRMFCEMPVQQVPFIILDLENKERILVKRIDSALATDTGRIRELYNRLPVKDIPRPVTIDYIRAVILALKKTTKDGKLVLFIDTMRSAFAGEGYKENDNDLMAALLYPLQALAAETGVCIILLHHNNKGLNHYSGGTVIAGAADYLWNWTSDKTKFTAKLEMDGGRDDHQYPLEFNFDMLTQRNVYIGKSPELKKLEEKKRRDRSLSPWLTLLPSNPDEGLTIKQIVPLALTAKLLKEEEDLETQERTARRMLQEAINLGYSKVVGKGFKNDMYKYLITETGKLLTLQG